MRIYMITRGLDAPTSYQEAVMQAAHVLDAVTVPPGRRLPFSLRPSIFLLLRLIPHLPHTPCKGRAREADLDDWPACPHPRTALHV